MKRALALIIAVVTLLSLAACGQKDPGSADDAGYLLMLDNAIRLPREYSRELFDKVAPPSETEYKIEMYRSKGEDYLAAVEAQYAKTCSDYDEVYGKDWVLSYTVVSVDEKDEAGIENYKKFDNYFFETYGIDTDKITAVVFVKVNVHIESPRDYNDKEKTIQCFCLDGNWYSFYGAMMGLKMA